MPLGPWFRHGELREGFAPLGFGSRLALDVDPVNIDPTILHPISARETRIEAARSWLATDYSVEFHLLLVDRSNEAITIADPMQRHLNRIQQNSRFTLARQIQFFSVTDGQTTDLRVVIPDEIESWGEAIAKFLSPSQSAARAQEDSPLSRFFRTNPLGDEDIEFARLLDHAFEVEVTGPKPAE